MLDGFDPFTITEPTLRHHVLALMQEVEQLHAQVRTQAAEIQRLRDENNRLRGEQGKPQIKPNVPPRALSSERERRVPKRHQKQAKRRELAITRDEVLRLDPALLPLDAQFKGYQRVIVQDIRLTTETIAFHKEKYYSASQHRTYLASMPAGYAGQFGPHAKALALTLYYDSGLSEPKIRALFALAGLDLSAGYLAPLLTTQHPQAERERQAILVAGLRSSPWQHMDVTSTRVNGVNQQCHVVCNPLYTVYTTLPHRDRLSTLDVLRGGAPRTFRLNSTAVDLMNLMGVPARDQRKLGGLPRDQDLGEPLLDTYVDQHGASITPQRRKWIKDALAIAAYRRAEQPPLPIVRTVVCDDAPQFHMLTEDVALCWVHDGRHYKKLEPRLAYHQQVLDHFLTRYWTLYHRLVRYREEPSADGAEELRQEFRALFSTVTGYAALDARIAITRLKQHGLLMVLQHPELLVHNNPAELAVRQRVRKRDVSFGPRSTAGRAAWDAFQTIVATARKLHVNVYEYLRTLVCESQGSPRLADLIAQQAQALQLGASWGPTKPPPAWHRIQVQCWHR